MSRNRGSLIEQRISMQETREDVLIERLKKSIRMNRRLTGAYTSRRQKAASPATIEDLIQAEEQIGFEMPTFLKRLYLEVGNGGFGPGYGLLPLNEHHTSSNTRADTLVANYLGMKSFSQKDIDKYWADDEVKPALWPERVLIICDWECNIYSCLNCTLPDLIILRMDNNLNFLVEWAFEAPSIHQWLEDWLDEKLPFDLDWEKAVKVRVSDLAS